MSKGIRFQVVCVLALFAGLSVQATQYWWSQGGSSVGGSNGTWNTTSTTNWGTSFSGPFATAWPNSYSDEAILTNTTTSTSYLPTMTLSGTIKVGTLTLWANGCGWNLTGGLLDFGSGAGTINLPNNPSSSANRYQALIYSPLAGSGVITVNQLTGSTYTWFRLYGNNTNFTGKFVFQGSPSGAFLYVTNDFNFGAVPSVYTYDALTFSGAALSLKNEVAATITVPANRGINNVAGFAFYDSGPWVVNSRITGAGSVTLRSTTVDLNEVSDYAGGTMLTTGGAGGVAKLKLGVDYALAHGVGKGNLDVRKQNSGGSCGLDLNGHNLIVNALAQDVDAYRFESYIDNVSVSASVTNTLTVGDNNAGGTHAGNIRNTTGTLNLTKIGYGTQILQGTNSYSGATTVSGGILAFDHTITPDQTHSTLTLNGGTLQFTGALATTNVSLTFTGGTVPFNAGGNGLTVTNRGGTATLTVGNTWTRDPDATLIVSLLGSGTSTLSANPATSGGFLWYGYCFVKDNSGIGHATVSGGNVIRYTSGYTLLDGTMATSNLDSTVRYYMNASQVLSGSDSTQKVDSITLNNGGVALALNLNSKVLVVGNGGVIFNNTVTYNDLGVLGASKGTVTAPGGSDLVLCMANNNNQARIYANIADNNGKVRVVIAGASAASCGPQMLGSNSYSGDTVVNGGLYGLSIPYGAGKGNLLLNSGGIVSMIGSATVNGLTQSSGNPGGWIGVTTSSGGPYTLTVGSNDVSASFSGDIQHSGANLGLTLIKVGNGTQTLAGVNNTYKAGTILSNGVLSVSADGCLGAAGSNVTFAGGTLMITGTNLTDLSSRTVNWGTFNGGLSINDSANTFTVTNAIGGTTGFTKSGAGTLVLTASNTYTGGTTVNNGTLKLGCDNAIPSNGTVTVASGAIVDLAGYNQTVANLAGSGTITNLASGRTLTITGTNSFSGTMAGSGTQVVTGVISPTGRGTIGQLTLANNLVFSGTYEVDVETDGTSDRLVTEGSLNLTGATLSVVNTGKLDVSKQYVVLTYSNAPTGSFTVSPAPWIAANDATNKRIVLRRPNSGCVITLQ